MKKFNFNQYGVCTNPEVIGQVGNNYIMVAKSELNGWMFGLKFERENGHEFGGYSPSIQRIEKRIDTRREAAMNAIKEMKQWIEKFKGEYTSEMEQCCEKAYDEINQTKLAL